MNKAVFNPNKAEDVQQLTACISERVNQLRPLGQGAVADDALDPQLVFCTSVVQALALIVQQLQALRENVAALEKHLLEEARLNARARRTRNRKRKA